MSDKPYFSLSIKGDSKKTLDTITATYSLTQSEVIEALLDMFHSELEPSFDVHFKEKHTQKMSNRKEKHEQKAKLKKLLSTMSEDDIKKLLGDK